MCTALSGYVYAGQSILIDGKEVAYYTSKTDAKSFIYYYTSDITIAPHWAPIAPESALVANLGSPGRKYTYDASARTWAGLFYYGVVSGISRCSSYKPQNTKQGTFTGLIMGAEDNSTIGRRFRVSVFAAAGN